MRTGIARQDGSESQRGRDFFQTAQELAIAEPFKDWPCLSQGSRVAGALREDDTHTSRVRDQLMRLSLVDRLSEKGIIIGP